MIVLVQNDTLPAPVFRLVSGNRPLPDLATATSVTMKLQKPSGAVVTRALSVLDATLGIVGLTAWTAGDLDEVGWNYAEIVVVWTEGTQTSRHRVEMYVRAAYAGVPE